MIRTVPNWVLFFLVVVAALVGLAINTRWARSSDDDAGGDEGFALNDLVELIATARGDRHTVDGLVTSFEAHMQREENDMFPAAEQLLGPDDWNTIDAAVDGPR